MASSAFRPSLVAPAQAVFVSEVMADAFAVARRDVRLKHVTTELERLRLKHGVPKAPEPILGCVGVCVI